jgi:outer membrane lipoprotein-sorting protein
MKYKLVFLLPMLFLAACSTSRFVPDVDIINSSEILAHLESQGRKISTLNASGRITVESPDFNGNFSTGILYQQTDSLMIKVTGPFGIQVGTLFMGGGRFVLYNQFANKFFNGSLEDFSGSGFLQFPLNASEMADFFTARNSFATMKIDTFRMDEGDFYIEMHRSENQYRLWIDPENGMARRIDFVRHGEIIYSREYGEFIKLNDLYFPRKIRFVRPAEKQALSVYYTDLEVNQSIDPEKFRLKISDKAEQIDLKLQNQ